ncbi:MAG: TetR/AcrR family transcriptional regulator [Thermoplasmata archaeon]|nr:TetR/AcrR family transcriptional regulator [Thermoplasmata archaeon]
MPNKKEAILETAVRYIAEQGGSFSTEQIASDLGCSQSLIFRYYHTKDGLMSACFDWICHELRLVLEEVEIPQVLSKESIDGYILDVWRAYCDYLESRNHVASAYMYFVSTGWKYPRGYGSAETVLEKILGDDYERITDVYPDFIFAAEYVIMISNVFAAGKFIEWKGDEDAARKFEMILMHGIFGMDSERIK